jgi:hypothetical protein
LSYIHDVIANRASYSSSFGSKSATRALAP